MSRLATLAVAVALLGGCQTAAADVDEVGSPGGSVAGTETQHDERPQAPRAAGQGRGAGSSLAHSLVAVASTLPSEATACERVCGSLGDCLLADEDYPAFTAGGLELECLDLCVHSDDAETAKIEFLACGAQDQCSALQSCAENRWAALAETRRRPKIGGTTVTADPCKSGCRWLWACTVTGLPPGEGYLSPEFEEDMGSCFQACDEQGPGVHETMGKLASCLPDHCSQEAVYECWR